jgi:hypothetical protein
MMKHAAPRIVTAAQSASPDGNTRSAGFVFFSYALGGEPV